MPFVDALQGTKKHRVMADTWGHLYPQPGSKHAGRILVMHHNGNISMLDRDFPTLENSPQEHELACSVLDLYDWADGLYEVSCTLWFFKTSNDMYLGAPIGKIIKSSIKTLYSTSNWSQS